MSISDWSSDVCSSDLRRSTTTTSGRGATTPAAPWSSTPAKPARYWPPPTTACSRSASCSPTTTATTSAAWTNFAVADRHCRCSRRSTTGSTWPEHRLAAWRERGVQYWLHLVVDRGFKNKQHVHDQLVPYI